MRSVAIKYASVLPCAAAVAVVAAAAAIAASGDPVGDPPKPASPIFGVSVPDGYRQWQLVAPSLEGEPLDELRTVVGNQTAIDAYRAGRLPFPDGTVLVKRAWKHAQSPDFPSALVPGAGTTVQVMVKDSQRYPSTGGWGFGRFVDGRPADEAQHQTCFACHEAVKARDYVFTRLAP